MSGAPGCRRLKRNKTGTGPSKDARRVSHFITKVRKKLDLDQREAAEIFGGGINAFSRYENGKTKPPLALGYPLPCRFESDCKLCLTCV